MKLFTKISNNLFLVWLVVYIPTLVIGAILLPSWLYCIALGITLVFQVLIFRWTDKIKAKKRQAQLGTLSSNSSPSPFNEPKEIPELIDNPSDRRSKDDTEML